MKVKVIKILSLIILVSTSLAYSAVTIKTNPIRYVGLDTAISGGNIISTGGEQITEAGICWSKNPQPTINDSKVIRSSATDSFTCIITNLFPEQAYYVRAYTVTASGVTYGPQRTFATDKIVLGSLMKGGLLFYVFQPGDPGYVQNEFHGMVVCPEMINPPNANFNWAAKDSLIGGTDTSMFAGLTNTTKIVTALGPGQYAAWMCYNLSYNGYTDWYLPSINELFAIRKALVTIPNQPWSSTEVDGSNAYQIINSRTKKISLKSKLARVVAIRNF